MKQQLLMASMLFVLFSCGTKEKSREPRGPLTPAEVVDVGPTRGSRERIEERVDIVALQSVLEMDRNRQLGYREKKFNTCEVGAGYSAANNCRQKTFVLIQFQLLCRSSEGTVSEVITPADLQPIANQSVQWTLKGAVGETSTNDRGFGEIAMVSADSPRTQRLRLTVGNDFLAIRAGEIQQLITPGNWCR